MIRFDDDERFIDEPRQQVQGRELIEPPAYAGDLIEIATARENRQCAEKSLFVVRKRVVAPLNRRLECLVPRRTNTAGAGKKLEALIKFFVDLIDGKDP